MLRLVQLLCLFLSVCFFSGSSCNNNTVEPTASDYKGTIYYSRSEKIFKIDLEKNTNTNLFENGREPELTKSGDLLIFEYSPTPGRLVYSDLTGANRTALLVATQNTNPDFKYRWSAAKPRISFDQKYVAYNDDRNTGTYIIDAITGKLIATIGDYSANEPYVSPSWFADGSLVVAGSVSMNNGIYKVSSDFKTVTRLDPNLSNVTSPSVSPDGTKIAFIRDFKLWMMNSDGTNPTQLYISTDSFFTPTWSPDSKYIAAVNYSGNILIFDPATLTAKKLSVSHTAAIAEQLSWTY